MESRKLGQITDIMMQCTSGTIYTINYLCHPIFGIVRHGFLIEVPRIEYKSDLFACNRVFIYKGDQYWRVYITNQPENFRDHELVRFNSDYPRNDTGLSDEVYNEVKEICQLFRLSQDPFKQMRDMYEEIKESLDKGNN